MFKNLFAVLALVAISGSAFAITPAIPQTASSGPIVIKAKPATTVKAKRAKSHGKKVQKAKTKATPVKTSQVDSALVTSKPGI